MNEVRNIQKPENHKRVLVISNKTNEKAEKVACAIDIRCTQRGDMFYKVDVEDIPGPEWDAKVSLPESDIVIVLGGDGSFLHASRIARILKAPIAGINCGHLGFLTSAIAEPESAVDVLDRFLNADRIISEKRCYLDTTVTCFDGSVRRFYALNELSITRGNFAGMCKFALSISKQKIANMGGDGIVLSSATGSTAYALSAGGPVVGPGYKGIICVPLAPHSFHSRSICSSPEDIIEIQLVTEDRASEAALFVDGDAIALPAFPTSIAVSVASETLKTLHLEEDSFYRHLSETFY